MSDLYVVVSHFATWNSFFVGQESLRGVERLSFSAPDNSVGFIPVYATREDAQAAVDRAGQPAQIMVLAKGPIMGQGQVFKDVTYERGSR